MEVDGTTPKFIKKRTQQGSLGRCYDKKSIQTNTYELNHLYTLSSCKTTTKQISVAQVFGCVQLMHRFVGLGQHAAFCTCFSHLDEWLVHCLGSTWDQPGQGCEAWGDLDRIGGIKTIFFSFFPQVMCFELLKWRTYLPMWTEWGSPSLRLEK